MGEAAFILRLLMHWFQLLVCFFFFFSETVTITSLLVALIRIMCTALPSASAKLVLDGKDLLLLITTEASGCYPFGHPSA